MYFMQFDNCSKNQNRYSLSYKAFSSNKVMKNLEKSEIYFEIFFRIDKKNVMPYRVWEKKLQYKMQVWYKIYSDCRQDLSKVNTHFVFRCLVLVVRLCVGNLEKKQAFCGCLLTFDKGIFIYNSLCTYYPQSFLCLLKYFNMYVIK